MMKIHTVAAGGGSLLSFDGARYAFYIRITRVSHREIVGCC